MQADLPKACLQSFPLLLVEGHAVGALVLGGIAFMGAYQNGIQRAVVLGSAVVGALTYGTLDALVGVTAHRKYLLKSFGKVLDLSEVVWPGKKFLRWKNTE